MDFMGQNQGRQEEAYHPTRRFRRLKKSILNISIALFSSFYVTSILLRQRTIILLQGYILLSLSSSFNHIDCFSVSIAINKKMNTSKTVEVKTLKLAWYLLLGFYKKT